ncbi:hypothetical protein ABZ686_12595 [Streptomyces sp. NPDC006992]|uniref:hypothetical protein n=1 Tax=Streptomyces sp. NPDC006992 TaxID=3155601 RepID=UPI0033E0EB95
MADPNRPHLQPAVIPLRNRRECDDCAVFVSLIRREPDGEPARNLARAYRVHLAARHDYAEAAAWSIARADLGEGIV